MRLRASAPRVRIASARRDARPSSRWRDRPQLEGWRDFADGVPGYTPALQKRDRGEPRRRAAARRSYAAAKRGRRACAAAGTTAAAAPDSRACPTRAGAADFRGSRTGSTRPATGRSRSPACAARSCSSTSGRTRASTASARCRTWRPGTRAYRKDGLTIVGVHTPEFAFEHVVSNVRAAMQATSASRTRSRSRQRLRDLERVRQPVLAGRVPDRPATARSARYKFGEGDYDAIERADPHAARRGGTKRRARRACPTRRRTEVTTPESYLGFDRLERYADAGRDRARHARRLPRPPRRSPQNDALLRGQWRSSASAPSRAATRRLRLHFHASDVYLVLGGHGTVRVLVGGKPVKTADRGGRAGSTRCSRARSTVTDGARCELQLLAGRRGLAFTFG